MLAFSSTALACDCVGPRGKMALAASHAAFRGTVTNIEYLDSKTGQSEPRILVTFLVSRVWRGTVKTNFVLHTVENSFSCAGFYFQKDKEYLVFAYSNDEATAKRFNDAKNTFGTWTCSGTTVIETAKNDLQEIGKGKKPKG